MSLPEEQFVVPEPPRVGGALRAAGVDLVANAWPLLPANVLVGLVLLATFLIAVFVHPLAIALMPLAAVPLGGLFRAAARVQREHGATLPDSLRSWRAHGLPSLALGIVLGLVAVSLVANVGLATTAGDILAAVFAGIAFWGFAIAMSYALVAWPLLVDPVRVETSLRERLRLAAILLVTRPVPLIGLTAILLLVLAILATLIIVPLLIGLAYVAAAACRYVLPLADHLEQRATKRIAG